MSINRQFNEPLNDQGYPNRPGRDITHGLADGFAGTEQEQVYFPAHIGGAPIAVNDIAGEQREASPVAKSLAIQWHLEGTATKTLSVPYNIRETISEPTSALWGVRNSVANPISTLWNARASVQQSDAFYWNTYSSLAKTLNNIWHTRALVAQTDTYLWHLQAVVRQSDSYVWNVPNLYPVYVNTQFMWNSGAAGIRKSVAAKWNTVGRVKRELHTRWSTNAPTAKTHSMRWIALSDYYPTVPATVGQSGGGYLLDVLYDRPAAYWRLADSVGPFADRAGSNNALITGTPSFGQHTLLSTVSKSTLFNNLAFASAALGDNWFTAGQEHATCALEVWMHVTPSQESIVLGRGGTGILVNSQGIGFRATTTAGVHDLIIPVETWSKAYHVVATYTNRSIILYINGKQAGALALPADVSFTNTSPTVEFGRVNGWLQEVAVYDYALERNRVRDHYRRGTRHADYERIVLADEPNAYWSIDDSHADVAQEFTEHLESDSTAQQVTSYVLDLSGTAQASKLQWRTNGNALVETSFDEITWTSVANDSAIPGIGNVDLTGKELFVRQTLNSPGYLDLRIAIYNTHTVSDYRKALAPASVTGSAVIGESQPIAVADSKKGLISKGGELILPAHSYQAIELWLRRTGDGPLLTTTLGSITFAGGFGSTGVTRFVINGDERTPVAADFPAGVWVHLYAELTDTSTITLANADVDDIATYAAPLPLNRIVAHYLAARIGRLSNAVRDTGLAVIEHDYDLAQHTWSVVGA